MKEIAEKARRDHGVARSQGGSADRPRGADREAGGASHGIAGAFGRSSDNKGLAVEGKARAAPAGIPNGGTMSGHGKRETILRANATRWRDRVCADMATATGCAALSEHRLSIQFVNDVVDAIAGCIAAGDDLVVNHHSSRRRLVAKFLAARGHVEIVPGDLLRPIGARDGELFG